MERLKSLVETWGGVLQVDPSGMGSDFRKRKVHYPEGACVGAVLRLLSSVFACSEELHCSDERSLLGWEYAVARHSGLLQEWLAAGKLKELPYGERSVALGRLMAAALERGLVLEDGTPINIR